MRCAGDPNASRGVGLLNKFCDPRVVYRPQTFGTELKLKQKLRLGIDPDGALDALVLPSESEALMLN